MRFVDLGPPEVRFLSAPAIHLELCSWCNVAINQFLIALSKYQHWMTFSFVLFNEAINGGVANFSKLIIKRLTGDALTSVALGIPFGAFQIFWVLSGTYLASRVSNFRTIVMFLYLMPTIIGTCLTWKLSHKTHKVGVRFGYYIVGAYVCSLVLALQMPAINLGGYTKHTTSVWLVVLAHCIRNIIGPHEFLAKEAPIYQTGCKVILACSSAQELLTICLGLLYIHRNKRRDAAAANTVGTEPTLPVRTMNFEHNNVRERLIQPMQACFCLLVICYLRNSFIQKPLEQGPIPF
ncbi:hypothetical protein UA08_09203 [Talaromyces atroroseus]|uniref:Uncharacterized protein n=1 Tax=Talaromyces atroroseus TaxID=1441469 RepID=A0A1Q5Q6K2_TALAT|nr:hypothetical protein UA08_09203 [Talaromyces atroroseus]OKL55475.1 hypothetical protein UA08_09203 [Talaromyces atroroseus]